MLKTSGIRRAAAVIAGLLITSPLLADDLLTSDALSSDLDVSHEFLLRGGATGATGMRQGTKGIGYITSQDVAVKYVSSVRFSEGPLYRVGGGWEGFWFERSSGRPAIPTRLDALTGVIGADFEAFDAWLFRIEAMPGYYGELSDGADFDDFNCPFILAATYIHDKDLQIVIGMGVDLWRDIPVFPAAGIRWKFGDALVLNLVPPNPRLEFFLSDKAMLFAGADLRSGTFRVGPETGTRGGETKINNAILEYTELRTGIGGVINLTPTIAMELQVGAVVIRRFDYSRADLTYRATGTAPYGSVALTAKF